MNENLLPLELRSNVRLCYDYCFSKNAELVFLRMYNTSVLKDNDFSRREVFSRLEKIGITTVPNGLVSEVLSRYDPASGLIVYTDERAHWGEGKIWVGNDEALRKYPNHWCSVAYPPMGRSIRHFQFGDRAFTMPFYSKDDWRSNRGQSTSYALPGSRWDLFPKVIAHPYFALDFIAGTDMVTDCQLAPGIEDDGLETWLKPRDMYRCLQRGAKILLDRGEILGDLKRGYGLVFKEEIVDEKKWLESLGIISDE